VQTAKRNGTPYTRYRGLQHNLNVHASVLQATTQLITHHHRYCAKPAAAGWWFQVCFQ
jgi:hypothetical protein